MTGPVFRGRPCSVVQYTPLCSGMCDAVILIDGAELAVSSHEIRNVMTGAPWLEPRAAAVARAERETLHTLRAVRARLIAEWHSPWPGAEHGKAIVGRAIDGAIAALKGGEE